MPRRREVPFDPLAPLNEEGNGGLTPLERIPAHPDTKMQALMEAAPGEHPARSVEELLPLRELLLDAMEQLTAEDRWIIDALVIERLSIREVSAQLSLSKSSVHRYRDRAFAALREALQDKPTIKRFISE